MTSLGCAHTSLGGSEADAVAFHTAMSSTYIARREWSGAMAHLQAALREDEGSPEAHYLLGVVHFRRGLDDEAELSLRRAIELDSDFAVAYATLGVLCDRSDRHEEARKFHEDAISRDPKQPDFHNNLGFSFYLSDQLHEAVTAFRTAIRAGGGVRVHNNLGFAYGRLGRPERAFREFKIGGSPAQAYTNLGIVYELREDFARAAECYSRALRLDPSLAPARKNLESLATRQKQEGESS